MIIKSLFLCAAMALPPVSFKQSTAAEELVREYRMVMEMLRKTYPDSEFKIGPDRIHAMPKGYSLVPIRWHRSPIYYRKIRRNA